MRMRVCPTPYPKLAEGVGTRHSKRACLQLLSVNAYLPEQQYAVCAAAVKSESLALVEHKLTHELQQRRCNLQQTQQVTVTVTVAAIEDGFSCHLVDGTPQHLLDGIMLLGCQRLCHRQQARCGCTANQLQVRWTKGAQQERHASAEQQENMQGWGS